jgi:hypothetical protein
VLYGTVSETGGYVYLTSPGFEDHVLNRERTDILLGGVTDKAGSLRATARFAPPAPTPNQLVTFALGDGVHETVAAVVVGAAPPAPYQLVQAYSTATETTFQVHEVPAILGDIVFVLSFDDLTNLVTTAVSIDGGQTFPTQFEPRRIFVSSSSALLALDASVDLTTTTTSTTTSSTTTISATSTTTSTPASTVPPTTSTLPCVTTRCLLDAPLQGDACAGATIPPSVSSKLDKAVRLIAQGSGSSKKAKALRRAAKNTLRLASKAARKATKGKKPKLSSACADAIQRAANGVLAGLGT